MTPHEKCQSFIALQNSRLERFDRTRTIQWNFNGILWTGIVVTTAFLTPHKSDHTFTWYGLAFLDIVLMIIHFAVINMIQSSLDYDKGKVAEYTLITERELGLNNLSDIEIKIEVTNAKSGQIGRTRKWLLAQLSITLLLLTSGGIIIYS